MSGMSKNVLGILSGAWLLQMAAALPGWSAWGWFVAAMAGGVLAFCTAKSKRMRSAWQARMFLVPGFVAALLAGYAYAAWRADLRLADALDGGLEGRDLLLTGVVASLPDDNGDGVRFVFEVEGVADAPRAGVPRRVLMTWYRAWGHGERQTRAVPKLWPGERWRLPVRLRLPHGSMNLGGFDYEAWLLERDLRATGNVRGDGERLEADAGGFMNGVHRLRARIREQFAAALPDAPYRAILVALAVGDQNSIPGEQWETLRRTGIQHLVAISGSHVTLVALLVGGLVMLLWRRGWPGRSEGWPRPWGIRCSLEWRFRCSAL